jgi:hypothetical protein
LPKENLIYSEENWFFSISPYLKNPPRFIINKEPQWTQKWSCAFQIAS